MTAGDEEAPLMYTMLAERHPEHTFYLIGRSDLTRLRAKENIDTLDAFFGEARQSAVPSNIIDLFEDIDTKVAYKRDPITHIRPDNNYIHDWLLTKVDNMGLKFDLGLIYYGPMPNVGIPGKGIMRLDGTAPAKSLQMFEDYYAPTIHLLNMRQTPWIGLCGDPKYVPSIARDILNEPKVIMSQTEGKFKTKRIAAYNDSLNRIDVEEDHRYAAIETIFMLDEKKVDWRDIDKDILFTVGLNGGQSRDKFIKDWFLDKGRTDVKVYGKWAEEFTTQYPDMFEEKRIAEVEDEFYRTKYTIIPPPHQPTGNFVTQKFWKMIVYGIIPFFHPGYDTESILPIPKILRIESAEDMWEKIDYLESNPEERKAIQDKLWRFLESDGLFDGSFLHNRVKHFVKQFAGLEL